MASASYSPEFRPFSSHIKSAHSEIDFSAVLGMETGKGKFLALDSSTMMITIEIKIIRIARWVEVDVNDVQKIFSYVQYIFVSPIKFHDGEFHRTEMTLREVCKKSKWKFKTAFAMKGGGGLGGHKPFLKNDFFKNHLESFPDCENVFCT